MVSFKRKVSTLAKSGFTIVELLVIAPVVLLTIGAFITVIVNMTGDVLASRASNLLAYNIQDALNRIEDDVKLSATFLAENSIDLTSPQGYDDGTAIFENVDTTTGNMLVLNTLATTANPLSTTSGLVYLTNLPNACTSTQVNQNTPMTFNVVYFVKNSTLWRRTIMPANYLTAGCVAPWQQPSCAPTVSGAFCKTQDIKLVENVTTSDFVVQYFDTADATIANSVASDSVATAAVRNAALQSIATVGVSINVDTTAGGRAVSQSGAVRATKLDINASTIAPVIAATTPSAPTVSTSLSNPTAVVATWPTVAGAESYTIDYNINGGSWINGFTNQTTTTYTVTAGAHTDTVNVRVRATNTAGTSGYGTSSKTIPRWTPLVLKNNWTDYGNVFTTAAYTKTSSGLVVLKGMIKAGSGVIANLPTGYRPTLNVMFENSTNSAGGRVDISANGDIGMAVGSNAWFSLDGIAFMPSSATFTTPTLLNSWLNYSPGSGDPNWQGAGYLTDSVGRVVLTGLIRNGTTTSGTPMFTLPAGSRPSAYMHVLNDVGNAPTHFSIDTGGNVLAKGYGNNYLSLQEIFFPSSRAAGATCTTQWCSMTYQNGWHDYSAPTYTSGQYTKSSDGLVMLRGLISTPGAATLAIATLPVGYCPAQTSLQAVSSAGPWARFDITRNGDNTCTLTPSTGASNVWLSMDGVRYIAE